MARMLEGTSRNARCSKCTRRTTHDTHSWSGRILTRSMYSSQLSAAPRDPGLDPLAHSSELDCSACPHLRPMLLPARARATRSHHRCSLGSIHLLVVKLARNSLYVEYRPCPCVQLHHLAARDYDALSGFESRSSYYYCVLVLFWSFSLVLLFLAFCGTTFLAFLVLHFFLPCLDDFF
jgi:hypothetical protein